MYKPSSFYLYLLATVSECLVRQNRTATSEQLGLADNVRDASKIQKGTAKYIVSVHTHTRARAHTRALSLALFLSLVFIL